MSGTDRVEVWLVRHGETELNVQARLSGWTDVELTACGRDQARWLKPIVAAEEFDAVWSSDLKRAVETARIVWGEPVTDERLREISFGDLEGRPYMEIDEELKAGLLRFEGFEAPGGEAIEAFSERVYGFLDGLPPGRHLVFAHGGVCRAVMRLTGPDRFLPTGSLLAVDWSRRELLFVRDNQMGTTSALVEESKRRTNCEEE